MVPTGSKQGPYMIPMINTIDMYLIHADSLAKTKYGPNIWSQHYSNAAYLISTLGFQKYIHLKKKIPFLNRDKIKAVPSQPGLAELVSPYSFTK